MIWLVKAIANGVKLRKLQHSIKKKKLKIKGKYLNPCNPTCCFTIFKTNKKMVSKRFCHALGKKSKNLKKKKTKRNKKIIIKIKDNITLGTFKNP